MSDAPTQSFPDFMQRMDALNTEKLVFMALRKCEPGNKRGNTSNCWKLDPHTRHQAARMHIVENKSAAMIHEELADRMTYAKNSKVSDRVLSTWLKSIRKAYGQLHDAQLSEIASAEMIAYKSGDLVALLGITFAGVVPKFLAYIAGCTMAEMSVSEQHVMLRFLETQTTAAKVQAEVREREARTLGLLQKSQKLISDGEHDQRDPTEVLRDLTALFDQVTGARSEAVA